jgi:hypothetical protein
MLSILQPTIHESHEIHELTRIKACLGDVASFHDRVANVRLNDGTIRFAELHWFEAHGIGNEDQALP